MVDKFEKILQAANCWGCPQMTQISGDQTVYCVKFAEGDPKTYPPADEVTTCELKNAQVINQLKLHHAKLGIGFLMMPLKDGDEGDVKCLLVGATGILFQGKLSELLPNETYVTLTSLRVFDEQGVDHTDLIMKKALQKAYEEVPATKLVFGGLLEEDSD